MSNNTNSTALESISNGLHPGKTRVRDSDGFVGTIMYVGPVASAKNRKEIYAGIAWDDASRGKHDGSVICLKTNQLVRHFSCKHYGSGSFLRLKKLDLGLALDGELLQQKYVTEDAPIVAPNNLLPHTARTSKGRAKPIEFLGELKIRAQQQLSDLTKISLRSMGIAGVNIPGKDSNSSQSLAQFKHLKEIDLAGNLLGDWNAVLDILHEFPILESISLASNRIQDVPPEWTADNKSTDAVVFSKIRVLNLNDCSIKSFRTVQWLQQSMPNLEEICIANSDLSDIKTVINRNKESSVAPITVIGFHQLHFLDCSSCNLDSWDGQVHLLGQLPKLKNLVLNDNAISTIPIYNNSNGNGGRGAGDDFSSLASIQLSGTAISSWNDLEGLNSLPNLKSLRFRNAPLTSIMGTGEARFLIIARFPELEQLNASLISGKERMEAERRYVSNVARDLLILNSTTDNNRDTEEHEKEKLLLQHPNFDSLMNQHKECMMNATASSMHNGANSNGKSSTLAFVLNVTIQSMAASSCSMEPLRKRLPGTIKVGRLKLMCSKAFGLDMDLQILHFKQTSEDPFPIELDDDEHTLGYYGVSDGAEILMNEVDVEAQARDVEREKKDLDFRIQQQESDARALQELQRTDAKSRSVAAEQASERVMPSVDAH